MLAEYTAAVLADDPEFYWQCQDAALPLTDSSGNSFPSNGSTQAGDISFQLAGPCGDDFAIGFAGGFANANAARNAVPLTSVNNFTLEWWVYYISRERLHLYDRGLLQQRLLLGILPRRRYPHLGRGCSASRELREHPTDERLVSSGGGQESGHLGVLLRRGGGYRERLSALPVAPTTQTLIGYIGSAMVYRTAPPCGLRYGADSRADRGSLRGCQRAASTDSDRWRKRAQALPARRPGG